MPYVNRTNEDKYDRLGREAKEDRARAAELKADKAPADGRDYHTLEFNGVLEFDTDRGVLYFHNAVTGNTLLRICGLPKNAPLDLSFVEITLQANAPALVGYVGKKEF